MSVGTVQFGTFDTRADRRDIVCLFQSLGEGLPDIQAREVRAHFLRMVVLLSQNGFANYEPEIDPTQCDPQYAYMSFVHIVGVLMVDMAAAVSLLESCVQKKMWLTPHWDEMLRQVELMAMDQETMNKIPTVAQMKTSRPLRFSYGDFG